MGKLNCSFEEEEVSTNVSSFPEAEETSKKGSDFLPELDYCLDSGKNTEKETHCPTEASEETSDHIFKQKNIKKGWKKNTNVPKFLVRVYLKYFSAYNTDKKNKKYYETHKKARKEIKKTSNNNFKISHILRLLQDEESPNA